MLFIGENANFLVHRQIVPNSVLSVALTVCHLNEHAVCCFELNGVNTRCPLTVTIRARMGRKSRLPSQSRGRNGQQSKLLTQWCHIVY